MNEIDPTETEAIIEAAAEGVALDRHGVVSELLTSLHAPETVSGHVPSVAVPRPSLVGRVARRTAVAATAAVLGVAGVAAAETVVFDEGSGGNEPVVEIIDGAEEAAPESETDVAGDPDSDEHESDEVESSDDTTDGDKPKGPEVDIEGVDASDGVDDDELAIACDAVGNHGEYVRLVARDRQTEHDGNHGDRVSEAAGSDCGKSDDDVDSDEADDDEADDDEAGDEADDGEADDDEAEDDEADGPGNGNGNGHTKGKGNGHGNGNNGNGNGNGHAKDVTDE